MGLFDKLTGKAKRDQEAEEARLLEEETKRRAAAERRTKREAKKAEKEAKLAKEQAQTKKSDKDTATENGEPYVSIVNVDLDPDNIGNGAFELDWNDKFIANLVRAGYQTKPNEDEHVIVDRWFQDVCRNILAENFEQWEANQTSGIRKVETEDLGNGKTSVS